MPASRKFGLCQRTRRKQLVHAFTVVPSLEEGFLASGGGGSTSVGVTPEAGLATLKDSGDILVGSRTCPTPIDEVTSEVVEGGEEPQEDSRLLIQTSENENKTNQILNKTLIQHYSDQEDTQNDENEENTKCSYDEFRLFCSSL